MRLFLAQATENTKGLFDNLLLDEWEVPFGDWIDQSVDWIDTKLGTLLDAINWPFETLINLVVNDFLVQISWVWVVLGMGLIATLVRNVKVGVFVTLALSLCGILGNAYWVQTAKTIGFIGVAVLLCVLIGLPIGVAAGRMDGVWKVIRPILDAMQVVHSFVYMLPFIFFWGIGEVSATMVMMIFALPPLIRLTNLGIRQVPEDVVEAARAYGASEAKVLFDVQLPLARPAIMTGINQTLLLAISMLGIAAIMGAGGLGQLLFRSLSNQDVALAASAGLAFFLVAVVLDRMSQREDTDSGNLFRRIHAAWLHRRDPETLIPADAGEAKAVVSRERFIAIKNEEKVPMAMAGVGGLLLVIAVFLQWTSNAGKISAYGSRLDQDREGLSFSGLAASGGSWFGIVLLGLAIFIIAAVVFPILRPGRGPRWLTVDGAVIASLTALITALGFLLAAPSELAADPGTGIGLLLAIGASALAVVGSVLWIRMAPHASERPLSANVAKGRLIAVGVVLLILMASAFSGWSFDGRSDIVITPEVQAQIDALRAQAEADPSQAAVIGNQVAVLVASAQATSTVVTDGVSSSGAGLGILTIVFSLLAAAVAIPAAGVLGIDERKQWIWSAIGAGIAAGIAAIAFAWIFTFVRNADPKFVSGIGSFMALMGGFFMLATTMPVLKDFRRARLYDDDALGDATPKVVEEFAEATA